MIIFGDDESSYSIHNFPPTPIPSKNLSGFVSVSPVVLVRAEACGQRVSSVLWPSSIRGLDTPWTYFLHLSLSSVILTDSSTESPVHVLMLSILAVRGLPRLHAPGIVPCIISFSRRHLPCFLITEYDTTRDVILTCARKPT